MAVKKLRKSVNICQSYHKNERVSFFMAHSVDCLHYQGRPKRQWMDDIEGWSGCSYIQLKEMSQDTEQWRRKTMEWSSAVANRHWRWL